MGRYDYENLRKQAIENPTFQNLEALANWFSTYDMSSWNGEFFDIGDGLKLKPEHGEEDENGCFPIVGYSIY